MLVKFTLELRPTPSSGVSTERQRHCHYLRISFLGLDTEQTMATNAGLTHLAAAGSSRSTSTSAISGRKMTNNKLLGINDHHGAPKAHKTPLENLFGSIQTVRKNYISPLSECFSQLFSQIFSDSWFGPDPIYLVNALISRPLLTSSTRLGGTHQKSGIMWEIQIWQKPQPRL
jgi:hypothetical protein